MAKHQPNIAEVDTPKDAWSPNRAVSPEALANTSSAVAQHLIANIRRATGENFGA